MRTDRCKGRCAPALGAIQVPTSQGKLTKPVMNVRSENTTAHVPETKRKILMLGRYSAVYEVIAQSPVPRPMPRHTVENPPTWTENPAQEYDRKPVSARMKPIAVWHSVV